MTQNSLNWDREAGIVRFATPTLGRDGGIGAVPLQAEVERPPFEDQPTFTIHEAPPVDFSWSDLYEFPDGASRNLGPIDSIQILETQFLPDSDMPGLLNEWSHVLAGDDELEGWAITGRHEVSLRSEPGRSGEIVEIIAYPTRMTVLELKELERESPEAYWPSGDMWALVRLEDGREGWVFLHALSYL
jgi:hypothetical protein